MWELVECRLDRCNEFLHGLDRKGLDAIADVLVIAGYSHQLVKLVFDAPNVEPNVVCPFSLHGENMIWIDWFMARA